MAIIRNPQNEFGAMSDVLAELYAVTGDREHLDASRLFNRPWFVGPLAKGEDRLAGLHANTHIAQAIGLAHCANLTGETEALKASENFWRIVTGQHSFVIGGNSLKEWFDKPGVETGPSIDGQKVQKPDATRVRLLPGSPFYEVSRTAPRKRAASLGPGRSDRLATRPNGGL